MLFVKVGLIINKFYKIRSSIYLLQLPAEYLKGLKLTSVFLYQIILLDLLLSLKFTESSIQPRPISTSFMQGRTDLLFD